MTQHRAREIEDRLVHGAHRSAFEDLPEGAPHRPRAFLLAGRVATPTAVRSARYDRSIRICALGRMTACPTDTPIGLWMRSRNFSSSVWRSVSSVWRAFRSSREAVVVPLLEPRENVELRAGRAADRDDVLRGERACRRGA